MIATKLRAKKCACCSELFKPTRPLQKACCHACAAIVGAAMTANKQRKVDAEHKQDLKPLNYWAKRAEKACNAFIRLRDAGDPCISCQTYDAPEYHAGHCYTVAARPDIRYNEDNIHLQCGSCNTYKGGMVGDYKIRVAKKIGQARLDALVRVNPAFKKTRDYYQEIEAYYKAKTKQLLAGREVAA